MHINWSKSSQKDLHDVIQFTNLEMGNLKAENIIITILKIVEKIADFPDLGKPGVVAYTREFTIPKTPFIIIYKVIDNLITVLRVFNTKRFRSI